MHRIPDEVGVRWIDKVCCEDAAIILPMQQIIDRAYDWGEMLDKVESLSYKKMVRNEYAQYLSLIFYGVDNTPAFDFDSGKFKPAIYELMKKTIAHHPHSRVAKNFKTYCDLLKQEGFRQTEKITNYWKIE